MSGAGRPDREDPQRFLRGLFDAALAAVSAERCVPAHLPAPPAGRTLVVGAGKAAAAMARAVEARWPPEAGALSGLVVTRYGHGVACARVEVVEAGHPVPDAAGQAAAARILAEASALGPDDLMLCLLSGGGSALLALPLEGLALADVQALSRDLLRSGADIHEMNTVRKHLSRIHGGRLAAACFPARALALVVSDVPGDDPATVASGPTVADSTTCADARAVLARYRVAPGAAVRRALERPEAESVKPGDARLKRSEVRVVATARDALRAAARRARERGITPAILGDRVEGEARDVALVYAALAREVAVHHEPFVPPCVLLSGGETTVTVRGSGRGGRNAEFLLALAVAVEGAPGVHALACDTDGIDGTEENAGVTMGPGTLGRARAAGLDPRRCLENNDGFSFFERTGELVITGPTRTNVNDFRAILVTGGGVDPRPAA